MVVEQNTRKRGTGNLEWQDRAVQFVHYIRKVYGFERFLQRYRDSRRRPQIPPSLTTLILVIGLWMRVGSLNQLGEMARDGELDRFIRHRRKPSADTLEEALQHADGAALWEYNHQIVRKARRNKVYQGSGTIAGWMVASLDGTELYRTARPVGAVRESWRRQTRESHNGKTIEYYERMVGACYVGQQPRLQLGAVRMRPGEDERQASLRLVDQLDRFHGPGWCDILCLDAGFVSAPFLNALRVRHKHVIVKVKNEKLLLARAAKAFFSDREPNVTLKRATCETAEERQTRADRPTRRECYDARIWDGTDRQGIWKGLKEPVRCLKVEETRYTRNGSEWVAHESAVYYVVTTVPQAIMKPETVWLIMHRRWDIENSLFNDLKENWHFAHCYTHAVQGIEAMTALYAIARNLLLLFAHRGIRQARPLVTLSRQITRGILEGRVVYAVRVALEAGARVFSPSLAAG